MAVANGVLESLAVSGRGEPDRDSELAFARRSVAVEAGYYNDGTHRDRSQHGIRGPAQAVISG